MSATAVRPVVTDAKPPVRTCRRAGAGLGLVAWLVGIVFFLPIAWMALTSFHSESDAATNPPSFAASLTLDGYREFFGAGGGASPGPPWSTRRWRRSPRPSSSWSWPCPPPTPCPSAR